MILSPFMSRLLFVLFFVFSRYGVRKGCFSLPISRSIGMAGYSENRQVVHGVRVDWGHA